MTYAYKQIVPIDAAVYGKIAERIHPAVYGAFQEIGFRPDAEPEKREFELIDLRGLMRT
jgi:hypothetical protein